MKNNIFILIAFFFFFSLKLIGQSYNEIITQAYSCAYIDNDYQRAAELFDKAFDIEKAKSTELYYAAEMNF